MSVDMFQLLIKLIGIRERGKLDCFGWNEGMIENKNYIPSER